MIPLTAEEFKRIKKIRDPLKPKKSLTAYNLFVKDIIPQLKRQEKGGNKGVGSLAAEFAERWRDLPEDQKVARWTDIKNTSRSITHKYFWNHLLVLSLACLTLILAAPIGLPVGNTRR